MLAGQQSPSQVLDEALAALQARLGEAERLLQRRGHHEVLAVVVGGPRVAVDLHGADPGAVVVRRPS
eukprot:10092473-Lingulodinium_polyedra.AAC.1